MCDIKSFSKTLLVSLVCSIFASYPNMLFLGWDLNSSPDELHAGFIHHSLIRFLLFWIFSAVALLFNQHALRSKDLKKCILPNMLLVVAAFAVYKVITIHISPCFDSRPIILTFQFFVIGIMAQLLSYTDYLNLIHENKEEELKQLKIESLQSRCTALTNQINPHFFFNSLNGIASLVRKKDDKLTITYIDHLSDIFRYVLQSEHKGIVTLEEELDFARSFGEVMQVRYAGKFDVTFDVPRDKLSLQIPVLALLPLIENVTVHNMIDSEHRMLVTVCVNENQELVVSNPVYPKQYTQETHGTGLDNLRKRFALLMNKDIRVEQADGHFVVALPLA